MGRWSAISDVDYDEELNGPFVRHVQRTCARCGQRFKQIIEAEYESAPWCLRCQAQPRHTLKESI